MNGEKIEQKLGWRGRGKERWRWTEAKKKKKLSLLIDDFSEAALP